MMNPLKIGTGIGLFFAAIWAVAGALGLPRPWRTGVAGFGIGVSAMLMVAVLVAKQNRRPDSFKGTLYGLAVLGEVLAIAAAIILLPQIRLRGYLFPTVGFIVGLHFLGLWKASNQRIFLGIAVMMCAICGIAVFVPVADAPDLRRVVVGLGCAVVLWGACLASIF